MAASESLCAADFSSTCGSIYNRTHQFNNAEMDKMQSKQHTLREEILTHNTLNCMVYLKKHPINKMSSCIQEKTSRKPCDRDERN